MVYFFRDCIISRIVIVDLDIVAVLILILYTAQGKTKLILIHYSQSKIIMSDYFSLSDTYFFYFMMLRARPHA